ncbi:uncharacterized protein FA14DRAFT_73990 [Meira miltonrushii]|uniref:MMS19 nucleotide excision repair protein n=1 Tax=Meira miltonrushii TaxID=1280837 RepID=A0A316V4Q8_9BASI|nr:uncharacterized protein FA14DRAFT_73990 [Meira miltonrushii]PWN32442.1 hypothetical protein FA14DRAFT_73990 [Meira miltonrushii]
MTNPDIQDGEASRHASSSSVPDETAQAMNAFIQTTEEEEQQDLLPGNPTTKSIVESTLPEVITAPWLKPSQSGQRLRLVEAVRFLGPALVAEDERQRLRAVVLLSLLITTLIEDESARKALFDKQAITTLTTFFASKIEDGNTVAANIAQSMNARTEVIPGSAPEYRRKKYPPGTEMLVSSLRALLAMSKLEGFASEAAKATTENLLQHSSPRVHPQAIRFLVYTLMDSLLSRHRNALKTLGNDFVKGYIELVEGEKDPRNLVYIFAMDRVVLIEWDSLDSETIENFFDVTYCYFPITFRPPPDDPYGISTNSLRVALRKALCASPLLAPHALPLLIEKMQASGGNAKRDTLDTLAEALPVFGRSAALAHAKELWQGYRIEIMHASDDATAICATRALESLLFVLYVDVEQPNGLAPEIVADMLDELEEPSKAQAKPASSILAAMIRATPATSRLAIQGSLDHLLGMYKGTDDISFRPSIMDHLNTVIKALREAYTPIEERESSKELELQVKEEGKFTFAKPASNEAADAGLAGLQNKVQGPVREYAVDGRPMDDFRDLLVATIEHGLKTSNTRQSAVEAFVNLSHIGLLTFAELRHLCGHVNELLIDESAEPVRIQALDGLRDIGNRKVVEETTLPLLFSTLPDHLSAADERQKGVIRRALGALAKLCDAPDFFDMLVVRLSTKLDLLCASKYQSNDAQDREANIGYARGIVNALIFVLQTKVQRKDRDTARHAGLVPRLLGLVIESALRQDASEGSVGCDRQVIQDIGRLLMLLVRCLDTTKQSELSTILYPAFMEGNLKLLARDSSLLNRLLTEEPSLKLQLTADNQTQLPTRQRNLMHPFASTIVALRKDVPAPPGDINTNVQNMIGWTINSNTALQEEGGSWLLADWINKHVQEPVVDALQQALDKFWEEEIEKNDKMDLDGKQNAQNQIRRQKRAIRIWLAMARGFLIKNSKKAESMVNRLIALFDQRPLVAHISVLHEAASGMGILLREDHVLCKENGSVIRLLYRQRFVTFALPKLLDGHKAANAVGVDAEADHASVQRNLHLVAICALLPSLPRATLMDRLADLFPLLILALDVHEDGVVQASASHVITLAAALGKRQRDEAILEGKAATALGRTPKLSAGAVMEKNSLDLVSDHINSILQRLLTIVVGKEGETASKASESTKVAALRSLATIARCVPYTTLLRHRTAVLRSLGQRGRGIDDAKRNVRLDAVDTRDAWYRLKGEEDEEETS